MKNIILTTAFVIVVSLTTYGQNKTEIVSNAKKLLSENKYEPAGLLLKTYYAKNSTDLEYVWLYAYTAHLNKQDELATQLYDKAISISPENMDLKLEYARMLYETGNLLASQKLVDILKNSSIDQSEVLLLDANLNYWNGKFDKANESLLLLKKLYPNSTITNELTQLIKDTKAPFFQAEVNYLTDNQPLEAISEQIKLGKFQSWIFFPTLSIKNYNFSNSSQVIEASLSNLIQFGSSGIAVKIEGGTYYNQAINKNNLIGEFSFKKSLSKKTNLEIGANRKPYIATIISTTYDLMQNNVFAIVESGDISKSSFIHLGYNQQFFADQNSIQTFGAWGLTKPILASAMKIQLGYGFSYSDSKTILYVPTQPTHTTTTNGVSVVDGEYSPYFTPDNLMINSAILVMSLDLSKQFKITAKGNYGFYAQANTPQLVANTQSFDGTEIDLNSSTTKISPFDLEFSLNFQLNKKLSISAKAAYFDTYYYNSLNTMIRLNYRF
jgi:hypothetical protein